MSTNKKKDQKARLRTVGFLVLLFCLFSTAHAFEKKSAFDISQSKIGGQLKSHQLRNTQGNVVNLADFLGKPLIVSLIYTSCYHICPTTTKHLDEVVQSAREVLGQDSFNVITIGFDSFRDTPVMMARFQERQSVTDNNWHFLSADVNTINSLTSQLGFLFEPSPHGFNHLIQATLVNSEGVIVQQTYGIDFAMPLLIEPLKRLVFNEPLSNGLIKSLGHKVLLFCTVYDPASNKYRFDYSLFIGMFIGFMSVLVLGWTLVREWRKTLLHR